MTLLTRIFRIIRDYRGLKKRITAIKEHMGIRKQAARENSKTSSSAETTPAPFNPTGVRRNTLQGQQQENGAQSQNSPVLVRGHTYTATPRSIQFDGVNSAPPVVTHREGYGSFGLTPPLSSNNPYRESISARAEAPNSPPEMTLPPPIKSISDLRINVLPGEGEQAKKNVETTASPDQVGALYH